MHSTTHRRWFTAALLASTALVMAACAQKPAPAPIVSAPPAPAAAPAKPSVAQNDLLNGQLWLQNSVEYKANSVAVYTLGRLRLDQALHDRKWTALPAMQGKGYQKQKPAIILDVDETVLDNSPYESYLTINNKNYNPKEWTAWCNAAQARAIPGSLEFLKYAASKGVEIFYITNRAVVEKDGTVRNLKALGYPMDPKMDTVLVNGQQPDWKSAKGTRDAFVAKNYRVMLMFGDNLGDFTDDFTGNEAARLKVYNANMAHWGHDWIAIANPAYGSWESTPYGNNFRLSDDEKRKDKYDVLEQWKPPAM